MCRGPTSYSVGRVLRGIVIVVPSAFRHSAAAASSAVCHSTRQTVQQRHTHTRESCWLLPWLSPLSLSDPLFLSLSESAAGGFLRLRGYDDGRFKQKKTYRLCVSLCVKDTRNRKEGGKKREGSFCCYGLERSIHTMSFAPNQSARDVRTVVVFLLFFKDPNYLSPCARSLVFFLGEQKNFPQQTKKQATHHTAAVLGE